MGWAYWTFGFHVGRSERICIQPVLRKPGLSSLLAVYEMPWESFWWKGHQVLHLQIPFLLWLWLLSSLSPTIPQPLACYIRLLVFSSSHGVYWLWWCSNKARYKYYSIKFGFINYSILNICGHLISHSCFCRCSCAMLFKATMFGLWSKRENGCSRRIWRDNRCNYRGYVQLLQMSPLIL